MDSSSSGGKGIWGGWVRRKKKIAGKDVGKQRWENVDGWRDDSGWCTSAPESVMGSAGVMGWALLGKVKGVRSTRPSWNKVFFIASCLFQKNFVQSQSADRATSANKEHRPRTPVDYRQQG
jgi:hypothetical protein